jgi:hypothetical protein
MESCFQGLNLLHIPQLLQFKEASPQHRKPLLSGAVEVTGSLLGALQILVATTLQSKIC